MKIRRNFHWVIYCGSRFFFSKRRKRGESTSHLSTIGIAVGVLTLITVISVMNGFQLGFIENILNVDSYHIRIYSTSDDYKKDLLSVEKLMPKAKAVPFIEVNTLAGSSWSPMTGIRIKGIPGDMEIRDPSFLKSLHISSVNVLNKKNRIILGKYLSRNLGVLPGDNVTITTIGSKGASSIFPSTIDLTVADTFSSGYYDYDSNIALVNIEVLEQNFGKYADYFIGLKFHSRNLKDNDIRILENSFKKIVPWNKFNESFFNALKVEKAVMSLLISLIFIVIAGNIFFSLKRSIFERKEEIAIIRSIGAGPLEIQLVFIFEGLLIGIIGSFAGAVAGVLITSRINDILSVIEGFIRYLNNNLFFNFGFQMNIQFFTSLPSRIIAHELFYMVCAGILSSTIAAYIASLRISKILPGEVLHYE